MSQGEPDGVYREEVALHVRRVLCLGLVAGYIDALGFIDLSGIYTGAMTGNTVQLGIAFARGEWQHFALVGGTLLAFFCGGLFSSYIRRRLPHPAFELFLMAAFVLTAQIVRLYLPHPLTLELPLLAISMAMQGETISRFGGLSIQTIVVTNNLLKFADAIIGRYISYDAQAKTLAPNTTRSSQADVVLPGCAWISYALGATTGTIGSSHFLAMIPPALLLLITAGDLYATDWYDRKTRR